MKTGELYCTRKKKDGCKVYNKREQERNKRKHINIDEIKMI